MLGTLYYGHNLTPEDSVPKYENSYYRVGYPYNQRPIYYSGYYKYFPGGKYHYLDSGKIELKLLFNSQIIASIDIVLKDTFPEWTKFNYKIPYIDPVSIPDTIIWIASAMGKYAYSNINQLFFWETDGREGSELHITEIKLSNCYDEEYVYSQNFCYGSVYTDNNFIMPIYQSGIYFDTLQNVDGCDSVIILYLTEYPFVPMTKCLANICQGESYNDNNFTNLTQAGTYYDTLSNINGCDSVVELTLTIDS